MESIGLSSKANITARRADVKKVFEKSKRIEHQKKPSMEKQIATFKIKHHQALSRTRCCAYSGQSEPEKHISKESFLERMNPANMSINQKPEVLLEHAPDYNPSFWNDKGPIQHSTNCYSYALNISKIPFDVIRKIGTTLQPGGLGGKTLNKVNIDPRQIIENCKEDAKATGGVFIEAKPGQKAPGDAWRVALVYSPMGDYHWYKEHSDGTWSHKRGTREVSNKDAAERIIRNPEKCDRRYNGINYSEFGGYFFVKKGDVNKA